MLKKILTILGAAFLVLIVLLAGILIWAQRSGAELQERFFTAVVSGDPEQVLALCDPALRDEIDAPILTAWMAEVRKQLGAFQGLSKTDFDTKARVTTEGSFRESKGTVHFQNGDATSDLVLRNDLLVSFSIKSEKIGDDWFKGPTDSTLYRTRGEQFIQRFFANDAAASAGMMHENLRKELADDKLTAMIDRVVGQAGALRKITYRDEKFVADDGQMLTLNYHVECEKANFVATVEFRCIGLKGHLWGFNFAGEK